jgi:hypothetical protein
MEDIEQKQPNVVALSGPQLPADHGLASLGLLMQLGGSIYAGLMSVMALTFLFTLGMAGGRVPGMWVLFLVLALSVVRSAMHRSAGNALVYGHPGGPFKPLKTYIWFSLIQTFVSLVLLSSQLHLPSQMLMQFGAMLIAWPVTLLIFVSSPRLKRIAAEIPLAEDKGFEGASVFMVLFGAIGTLITGFMLYMMLKGGSGAMLASGPGMLILGAVVMLLIRGIFHFLAGQRGIRGATADEAVDVTQRYYNFGIITSWVVGGVFLLIMLMSGMAGMGIGFVWVSMFVYILLAWPLIIRRFFAERQFADILAGEQAPLHQRAPDMGLTALGWLLLATGVMALAQSLPMVLQSSSPIDRVMARGAGDIGGMMSGLSAFAPPSLGHSPWWMIGMAALQIWAAVELVRMTDRHKIVGTIFGAVSIGVTLYVYYPLLKNIGSLIGMMPGGGEGLGGGVVFISLGMGLVMPVGTLLLVHRRHTPSARARVRGADGQPLV